jgi:hypothetical protein
MRIVRPLIRKATKTVVYPMAPIVPITKSVAFGTRRGNLNRKELRKQTELLEQQNAILAQQAQQNDVRAQLGQQVAYDPAPMVTPDGKWASYDGGITYVANAAQQSALRSTNTQARPPQAASAPSGSWYVHPSRQAIASHTRATVECFTCHARFDVPASQTSYTCPSCPAQNHLRLCPGCSKVVHIPHAVTEGGIKCKSCGIGAPWAKWDERPVTAAQYAYVLVPRPDTAAQPTASSSIADELAKVAKLHDDGVLTDAEFASAKARLLG